MNELLKKWAAVLKNLYIKVPLRPKRKKHILIILTLLIASQFYWDRENFHQFQCNQYSKNDPNWWGSYYVIRTSPLFFNSDFGGAGTIVFGTSDVSFKKNFFDTGAKYSGINSLKWSKNMFGSQGVLSLHNGNWSWTVGNITSQCWSGLKRYINKLEIEDKPTLIEE